MRTHLPPIRFLLQILLLFWVSSVVGQEICDDGIDNDGDGFIDYYDEDCGCNEELFNAACDQECVDTVFSEIKMRVKWKTDYLNQGTNFRFSNFVVLNDIAFTPTSRRINSGVENLITSFNLFNGEVVNNYVLDTSSFELSLNMVFANEVGNNRIYYSKDNAKMYSYDLQINSEISSDEINNISSRFRYFSIADINQSGDMELYSGSYIINNNGELLFAGASSEGSNFINPFNFCSLGAFSIASDFTDHIGLELACGNVVYEANLINTADSVGNTANVITAPPEVLEGYTAMGDFDGDGRLEVVSSRGNGNDDGGVWIWNPRDVSVLASSIHPPTVGGWGGVPTIADVDNDCVPEVVVIYENVLKVYTYDGTSELKILHERTIVDGSGYTIPTVFDLNSDGNNEIIYRDEEHLFILDGPSGMTLDSF